MLPILAIAVPGGTTVEWYLDGARVAEGNPMSIDLPEGDQLLTVMLWNDAGSSTSMDIPLSVVQPLADFLLTWGIPSARENGDPLPVTELCCYQVTIIAANTLSIVDVSGGTTTRVQLELRPSIYRFSIVAIDNDGLISAPSDTLEADLTGYSNYKAHHTRSRSVLNPRR